MDMKDKELEKYYEEALSLFSQPGWKEFVLHMDGIAELLKNSTLDIEDSNTFFKMQGKLHMALSVVNYENWIRSGLASLEEEGPL